MENLLHPTEDYPFEDILIKTPRALQGGTFCANLEINGNPIIIQTPKCKTKNGIHKTAKQLYCDLLFDENNENFVNWMENLQETIRTLIFENNSKWFHEELTMDDIEYHWNDSLRSYRKMQLLRTFIHKSKRINNSSIQIYDTDENELTLNDVTADKKIVSIIEIIGLKFSSQSFHLDICLRQIMVINEKPLFNRCLIKLENNKSDIKKLDNKNLSDENTSDEENTIVDDEVETCNENLVSENVDLEKTDNEDKTKNTEEKLNGLDEDDEKELETNENIEMNEDIETNEDMETNEVIVNEEDIIETKENLEKEKITEINENIDKNENIENNDNVEKENLDIKEKVISDVEKELNDKKDKSLEKTNDLEEIELNIDNIDTIKLKEPNEVYLDIYKAAREKAKKAKNEAIKAYLEAKKIKELYMLDIMDSSDEEYGDSEEEEFIEDDKLFSEN